MILALVHYEQLLKGQVVENLGLLLYHLKALVSTGLVLLRENVNHALPILAPNYCNNYK